METTLMELIYEITKISLNDIIYDETLTKIDVSSQLFGYFKSEFDVRTFIKKHNHDTNCFFIVKSYVFNPNHNGQANDNVTEALLNYKGEIICRNSTHHFIINFNSISNNIAIHFSGRDDDRIKLNDYAWYYNKHDKVLQKCIVKDLPFNTETAKKYDSLDYLDDSYIVYPLPLNETKDTHRHILSSYMLTDLFVKEMCK